MSRGRVVIVGGGLAGLSCAHHLHQAGVDFLLLEAAEKFGGRVRTDRIEGFLLDRGFQVFLTAYPEARRQLDYQKLDLRPFYPGAMIKLEDGFKRLSDPWRHPVDGLRTLFDPVAPLPQLLSVVQLRRRARRGDLSSLFQQRETTTLELLQQAGAQAPLIERFFRPFFGGVFLDEKLETSSRMFDFVLRMMAKGETAVPAGGMEEIPRQMARQLPPKSIRTGTAVQSIEKSQVVLSSGEQVDCGTTVVATDGANAVGLLPGVKRLHWRGVSCLYFVAEKPPIEGPFLVLNGEGKGPINNLAVMIEVAPDYGPSGASLISVSVLGVPEKDRTRLEEMVKDQLESWFGSIVRTWWLLRHYQIPRALPDQRPPALSLPERPVRIRRGLYVCGDHRDNASINGALASGRRAAEALLEDQRS